MSAVDTVADLAARLGLHRSRDGWRGDCPACSYPGAFAMRGRGERIGFFCASCGDRDSIAKAVRLAAGCAWARTAPTTAVHDPVAVRRRQERALALWNGAVPVIGTVADHYLIARGLPGLTTSTALRFRADTPHPAGGRLPALLAQVVDAEGRMIALHRTYLRADGTAKADVDPPRATLGPVAGGAVRLDAAGEAVVVGEGIESAASAARLLDMPAWAALSAGNLASGLVLPARVRGVVIAADPDNPGERAARAAALRWTAERRQVRIALPAPGRGDFNDLLLREATHA